MAYYKDKRYKDQTEWNMDDEVCKIIRDLKISFNINLKIWDLEQAYWDLMLLWGELDSLLDPGERKKIKTGMGDLENIRNTKNNKKDRGDYWMGMHEMYRKMCRLMQEHGVYFRIQMEEEGL